MCHGGMEGAGRDNLDHRGRQHEYANVQQTEPAACATAWQHMQYSNKIKGLSAASLFLRLAKSAGRLTDEHHEQAGVEHGCVEALAGGDKGREGPEDEGDEHAPEDGLADPRVAQAQLLHSGQ